MCHGGFAGFTFLCEEEERHHREAGDGENLDDVDVSQDIGLLADGAGDLPVGLLRGIDGPGSGMHQTLREVFQGRLQLRVARRNM